MTTVPGMATPTEIPVKRSLKQQSSFRKTGARVIRSTAVFANKGASRFRKAATLNDARRFPFDKFMLFGGLWYNRLESFTQSPEERHLEALAENRNRKPIITKMQLWCGLMQFGICIPTLVRWSLCWVWTTESGTHWLQNLSSILGGSPYYHLGPLTLWAMQDVIWTFECWRAQRNGQIRDLLAPFIAIHYPQRAKRMGIPLTDSEMRKMRIVYNLGALNSISFAFWGGCSAIVFAGIMWAWRFGLAAFGPWTLFMTLQTIIWAVLCAQHNSYRMLLFHVTCFMFGLRFERGSRELATASATLLVNPRLGRKKLSKALDDFMRACADVERYNRFWKRVLGLDYFAYIGIVTILLFDVAFADIPFIAKQMWGGVLFFHVAMVGFMAYSGDIVSRRCYRCHAVVASVARLDLSMALKLKLRAVMAISGSNRIETPSFQAKRQTRWIGFSVLDLFVVSDNDYIDILVAIVTYLLLTIQLSRS